MPSFPLPTGFADRYGGRRLLLPLLLATLAGFTLWLQWYNRPTPQVITPASTGPDYYLRNFTLTATGADGLPRYIINSEYMEYMAGQEMVTFLHPSLFFNNEENHATWWIEGDKARITEQGRWIMMQGDVVLKQYDKIRDETMELKTADLLVLPEQKRAESSAPVSLTAPNTTIRAVGLRVDLAQNRLELLHRVKGRYRVPPS